MKMKEKIAKLRQIASKQQSTTLNEETAKELREMLGHNNLLYSGKVADLSNLFVEYSLLTNKSTKKLAKEWGILERSVISLMKNKKVRFKTIRIISKKSGIPLRKLRQFCDIEIDRETDAIMYNINNPIIRHYPTMQDIYN